MGWPVSQDYNEAIQDPQTSLDDPELRGGEATTNALGMPMPRSGNFADVYEFNCRATKSKWAIKCFTRQVKGLRERYSEISRTLQSVRLPFAVEFQYLEKGIRVRGEWYPILKMSWVEGLLLNEFVRDNLDKPALIEQLGVIWGRMGRKLREAGIAHADLQHGNVLLVPGSKTSSLAVKLIDYDGMFVPALAGITSGEVGHPNYQHPERLQTGTYNTEVDRFPLLVVATALRAVEIGGRSLWDRYDNGDNLLFRETDLNDPAKSPLFKDLRELADPQLFALVEEMSRAITGKLADVPTIDEVLSRAKKADSVQPSTAPQPSSLAAPVAPEKVENLPAAGPPAPPVDDEPDAPPVDDEAPASADDEPVNEDPVASGGIVSLPRRAPVPPPPSQRKEPVSTPKKKGKAKETAGNAVTIWALLIGIVAIVGVGLLLVAGGVAWFVYSKSRDGTPIAQQPPVDVQPEDGKKVNPPDPVGPDKENPPVVVQPKTKKSLTFSLFGKGAWWLEGNELVLAAPATPASYLLFGDKEWADYDIRCETQTVHGQQGSMMLFRGIDGRNFHSCAVGTRKGTQYEIVTMQDGVTRGQRKDPLARQFQPGLWYEMRLSVRGASSTLFLNGNPQQSFVDETFAKGRVGLASVPGTPAVVRWKNIRVTAPNGALLWSGLPPLPASAARNKEELLALAQGQVPKVNMPGDPDEVVEEKFTARTFSFDDGVPLASGLVWAPDGQSFYVLSERGLLRRVDARKGDILQQNDLQGRCGNLVMSGEGLLLSMLDIQQVWIVDPRNLNTVKKKIPASSLERVAAGFQGKIAVAGSPTGLMYVVDLQRGTIVQQYKVSGKHLIASPDGQYFFSQAGVDQLFCYRLFGQQLLPEDYSSRIATNGQSICVSPDSRYVCLPAGGGNGANHANFPPSTTPYTTYVYQVNKLKTPLFALPSGAYPQAVGFDPKSGLAFAQNSEKALIAYSFNGVKQFEIDGKSIKIPGHEVREFSVTPLGNVVLLRGKDRVVRVTVKAG